MPIPMKTIEIIYLWWQVIMSVCVILFGTIYAIRCIVEHAGDVYVILFGCMAYVAGYRLMYRASIEELREARARRKGGKK